MKQEEDELTEMIPLWLRSHPEHEERIVVLQAQIGALPSKDYQPLDMDWVAVKAEFAGKSPRIGANPALRYLVYRTQSSVKFPNVVPL